MAEIPETADAPLNTIASDYERGEVTVLCRQTNAKAPVELLFAVAELCPSEQPESERFGTEERPYLRSHSKTLFAFRAFVTVNQAMEFFRGTEGKRTLAVGSELRSFETNFFSETEPPNENLMLIPHGASVDLGSVLPWRPGSLRTCSRFSDGDELLAAMSERERNELREFGEQTMGIDLVRFYEHVGALHLVLTNPILRNWKIALAADERHLLVDFFPRAGRSAEGLALRVTEERAGGIGFDLPFKISLESQVLPIPYSPGSHRYELRDKNGVLLESHPSLAFMRSFAIDVGISTRTRVVQERTADDKVESREVPIFSFDRRKPPPAKKTLSEILSTARATRSTAPGFQFFPRNSRAEAREVLRDLINKARDRVLLCDPYLTVSEVNEYVLYIPVSRLPVQLLGSAFFLRKTPSETAPSHGEELARRVKELQSQDATLRLEARVLPGNKKSPVHDRFLLVDETVYVLGSSLNEFGTRATTLIRAPEAANLRDHLLKWWNEDSKALGDWLPSAVSE